MPNLTASDLTIIIDTGVELEEEDVEKGGPQPPDDSPSVLGTIGAAVGTVLKTAWDVIKPREDDPPAEESEA